MKKKHHCKRESENIQYNKLNNKISQNVQFAIPPVKMNELLQDLLNLDINKSTGTDNIGPKILKVSAPFIVSPLYLQKNNRQRYLSQHIKKCKSVNF